MSLESRRANMLKCDRCSTCKWTPTMPEAQFASACPSIEYGQFHTYSGGGKNILALAFQEGRMRDPQPSEELLRSVYACSACGACDTACKWSHADTVEPLETIYELRVEMVARQAVPQPIRTAVEQVRHVGNRYGRPRDDRSRWAHGLQIKRILEQPADVLLHVGCENAFDERQWPELRACVALLQGAGIDFGMLYDDEVDCGSYAFDAGFRSDAQASASDLLGLIQRAGASRVITCSAIAFHAFKQVFPRLSLSLGQVQVEHITQTLARLVQEQKLAWASQARSPKVTYHDSCKLGRLSEPFAPGPSTQKMVLNQIQITDPDKPVRFGNGGLYDAPRQLLDSSYAQRVEMPRSHQFSYCCGALGGGKEAYEDFANLAARQRLTEAQASGAEVLLSACGACTQHLRAVAADTQPELQVRGLIEYLAERADLKLNERG
jgi:Fe-S oxidoreductase